MRHANLLLATALIGAWLVACGPASPASPTPAQPERLILATTTSTADSGLLDYILPDFEAKYNVEVDMIAVGTGQALEMGEAGDADEIGRASCRERV